MEAGIKRFSIKHIKNKVKNTVIQKLHPDWPWWPSEAVSICEKLLRTSDIILEFGSGRSTAWLALRSAKVISIESNEEWYNIVKEKIAHSNIINKVELIYAPVKENEPMDDQPYLAPIKTLQKESIDVIIIDGKFRAHASELSLPLLRPGGILIIDDAHRFFNIKNSGDLPNDRYRDVWNNINEKTKNWRRIWTSDGIHATLFLIKP